jgi:hypothetical protein
MKRILPVLALISILVGIAACKKNTKSPIPVLTFLQLSPDSVKGGASQDTAYLAFAFADGDGDLGNDPTTGQYDVFLHDSRDSANDVTFRYIFPDIPADARDPIEGIHGEGVVELQAALLLPRQDTLHKKYGDTAIFEMWIQDQAHNKSNVVKTTPLYIRP